MRYLRLFWVYHKKHDTVTNNPSVRIYVNKIECYLELLTTETMKLLGNAKSNINKDKNGKNVVI